MRGPAVLAALAALVLVACNGDDDTTPATSPSTTTTVSTTVSEPTTTTTPPTSTTDGAPEETTTTVSPATTPPETTSASTLPPTSTLDPNVDAAVQARIDVIERTEASWAAVRRLYEDPFNDDLAAALSEFFTGNQLEGFENVRDQFRDGNFRSIQRDGSPEIYEADPRSVTVNLDAGSANVQVCHVNTAIIVETGGNPDGTDRVARDEITEEIVELDLVLEGDVWKVSSARTPEVEIATCP